MKNGKILLFVTLASLLTSCGWQRNSSSSAARQGSISSESPSSMSEEPEEGKNRMQYTVEDYVANNYWPLSSCPTNGYPKILIIPVWFSDSSSVISSTYKERVREDIETAFLGTEEETGWHSVSSYYSAASAGKLNLEGVVTEWYECGYRISTVGRNDSYTDTIIEEAVDWYFEENPSENRRDFDYDGDGYIDGIVAIYAAPNSGNDAYSRYDNLWAYCYWLQNDDANKNNPATNAYCWASYDFMYGSSTALSRSGKSYYGGDTSHCTIDAHTYIHEFGHILGLEDYYDYSYQYNPAGGFSMQDGNVGGHDPYSVMAMGWADPYIPTETCTIEIGAFQSTNDLILLTPSWNSFDSPFDEYLLLELYTPTGLNKFDSDYRYMGTSYQGPSETGIRLWHVDGRLLDCSTSSTLTSNPEASPIYGVLKGMSNSYYSATDSESQNYLSELGRGYYDYNELQLIRNDIFATYRPEFSFGGDDLFMDGDSFSMSEYSRQFVNGTSLNSGATLGWSFSVSITGSGENATASITCTKN